MSRYRCALLSVVKHDYIPRGVVSHPQFDIVVVADDPDVPSWAHHRNQLFADEFGVPYVRDIGSALRDYHAQVAVISSEAERHCDLSVRAADAGLHIIQDKPMSNRLSECDRVVEAVERNDVRFLMWNRNCLPAVEHAREIVESGEIGELCAVHVDFYFAKDCGPPLGSLPDDHSPIDWLNHQISAHADGSDGGIGREPMGELQVEGIYPLGYIRVLTGDAQVERVFATSTAHFHQLHADNNVDDLATVSLELSGGVKGTLCIGRIGAASHPDLGGIKIHAVGTKGGLVINEARPEVSVYYRGQAPNEFRNRRVAMENDYLLMQDFAEAIEQCRPTKFDARASRDVAAIVAAAIQSSQSQQVEMVRE